MNQYQEALNELVDTALYYHDCITGNEFDNAQGLLQELIDMHSHPLKLKEIEAGMWVWHNTMKEYIKVSSVTNRGFFQNENSYLHEYYEFEEGRFYRYQPLE